MVGLAGVLCFCAFFGSLQASAIPMWEYLSKDEKTSYIYSLFANEVERFCDGSVLPSCNRNLLKYGLGTLKNIDESTLDSMDPYQRGANNIIWETLMQGHRFMRTTPKPRTKSTTAKPNSYEDESFSDIDEFGSESAASAKFDNVYILPPPKDFVLNLGSGKPEYVGTYPKNSGSGYVNILRTPEKKGIFNRFQNNYRPIAVTTEKVVSSTENPSNFEEEDEFEGTYIEILRKPEENGAYSRFQNNYRPIAATTEKVVKSAEKSQFENQDDFVNVPLNGPMIIRVYPDGTPVQEPRQMPQDDDLKQYEMTHVKIPNL